MAVEARTRAWAPSSPSAPGGVELAFSPPTLHPSETLGTVERGVWCTQLGPTPQLTARRSRQPRLARPPSLGLPAVGSVLFPATTANPRFSPHLCGPCAQLGGTFYPFDSETTERGPLFSPLFSFLSPPHLATQIFDSYPFIMADIDLEKKSSHSGEQHASAPRDQEKVVPSADYIENYKGKSGYSRNFAAIAEAKGFKPDDGRLVVDPEEAKIEYGEEIASLLKTNKSGTKILWPQPSDDPNDPQNWSPRKKNIQLLVLTMASFVPDFASGIGIAGLFGLAATFKTTTDEINNLTSNWSIFCLGPGGIVAVMLIKRYGRLPVLFWSQLIGLGFLIGCAVAPNLHTFAAMRILNAFFSTAPQCAGLFTVCDLFPFHLQARKLNLWTMGFIVSPFVSPFLLGFMVASKSWRDAYWVGVAYVAIVVLLITFVMEETMYDREVVPFPERPTTGLRYRIETLVGITGIKMAKYRSSWVEALTSIFDLVWRPHALLMLIYVGVTFGFGIGINVTNAVFTGSPPPLGYGFSAYGTSAGYATPIVAVILGELAGRYFNDLVADRLIKRNKGVFLAEFRLWTCYIAMPFFVVGFIVLGAAFQKKLSVAALVFGWGLAEFAILVNTVAVYNYLNNCFPTRQGEVSALVNFARTMGGFAVPYYQVPYSLSKGPLKVFGMEAGVGAGLFLLIIPFLQIKGPALRHRFSIKH